MPVTRPSRYPQVAGTPGGNFAEPPSGVQLGGWPTGAIYPSSDANWLWRQITDWNRHHDATRLAAPDILTTAIVQRVSTSALTVTTGVSLTVAFTVGGVYYGAGERLDLTTAPTVYAGGAALVMPAGVTRYLIARPQPPTGGVSNGSSCAELALSATTPVAGWSTLMTLVSGATTISTATQHVDVVNRLTWGIEPNFAAGLRGTTADLSDLMQAATGIFSGSATGGDTLTVTSLLGGVGVNVFGSSGGKGIYVEHEGTAAAIDIARTGSGVGVQVTPTGSGTGVQVSSAGGTGVGVAVTGNTSATAATVAAGAGRVGLAVTGSGVGKATTIVGGTGATALEVTAGAGQYAAEFIASATSNSAATFTGGTVYAVQATGGATNGGGGVFSGTGLGIGVGALSGTGLGANALQALARNYSGYAVYAQTDSSSGAAAAWLEGRGGGAGAELVSADFYPLILTPDVTSATYGAMFVRTQNAYPSSAADGAIAFASSSAGVIPHLVVGSSDDGVFRGVHTSVGGRIYGKSLNNSVSNSNTGSYTTVCTIVLGGSDVPKQSGRTAVFSVKLRVRAGTSGTSGGLDLRIVDNTAGVTFCEFVNTGTGATNNFRVSAVSTNWENTVAFDYEYTMPITSRSFTLAIKRAAADAFTVSVQGGMIINGLY